MVLKHFAVFQEKSFSVFLEIPVEDSLPRYGQWIENVQIKNYKIKFHE